MQIEEQFNRIANEYDENRRKFIPCFDDFYETTTDFICANITPPSRILDLGAGTGLLSYYWYQHFPKSHYVLVDIADDMLEVAKRRFSGLEYMRYETMDYSNAFPHGAFDCILSALSIHHLPDADKQALLSRIYDTLPSGGIFVNYDQFCGGSTQMNDWFDRYWESQLAHSGLTDDDIKLWHERRLLDRECSVQQQVAMLEALPFQQVKCVYSYQKFAVIVACK